jgi:hypothetical protein
MAPIPRTKKLHRREENLGAANVERTADVTETDGAASKIPPGAS